VALCATKGGLVRGYFLRFKKEITHGRANLLPARMICKLCYYFILMFRNHFVSAEQKPHIIHIGKINIGAKRVSWTGP